MSDAIRQLEPIEIWSNFADLNAVPRPSKKEERVIAFIKTFGASLDLETFEDEVGNVIIKKPATPGMEDRKTFHSPHSKRIKCVFWWRTCDSLDRHGIPSPC